MCRETQRMRWVACYFIFLGLFICLVEKVVLSAYFFSWNYPEGNFSVTLCIRNSFILSSTLTYNIWAFKIVFEYNRLKWIPMSPDWRNDCMIFVVVKIFEFSSQVAWCSRCHFMVLLASVPGRRKEPYRKFWVSRILICNYLHRSGSFHQQAKILRQTLISTI